MKKGIFQRAAAWLLTFVLMVAMTNTAAFSVEVKADEGQGENEEPVYAGCLVNETDFQEAVFDGDSQISEEDYEEDPYIGADSLEELFSQAGEKDIFQGYLLIWINGQAQTSETAVSLPDTLGNTPVEGIVIMAYEENAPLQVNQFIVNAPLAIRGVVDGDLKLNYPNEVPSYGNEEDGTYFEGVLLLNAFVSGSVFACDEEGNDVTEAAGAVTIGDSTHIGGIHGIEKTVLKDELIIEEGEGSIEFWTVETQRHYRELLIAGYKEERIPIFHRNVEEEQDALDYCMLLEDLNTYPVKEYQDGLFVKKGEDYYSVWWVEDFAVSGVREDSKVTDETFIKELNTAFSEDTAECYVVSESEYSLYRYYYEDDETGEICEAAYIQKEDDMLYQEDTEVYSQLGEELQERVRNSMLFPAAETGEDSETVAEKYQYNGGRCRLPNIAVRYIDPESLGTTWEDMDLAAGTKVIRYRCPNQMSAQEEFSYRNYTIEDETIDLITDVDGIIYDKNQLKACYSIETMSEEEYQNYGIEDVYTTYLKGDVATLENALDCMEEDAAANGSGYYKIFINICSDSLFELEKIAIPEHVKGIILDTSWYDENTPNRILFDEVEFSDADQEIRFLNLFFGSEEENTPSAKTFTVSGAAGKVLFSNCRMNQKIDGGNAKVTFLYDNYVKEYSGGQSTELLSGVLCVEDALDVTFGEGLKADRGTVAARADAKLNFGKISTLTGNQIAGEEAGSILDEGSILNIVSDTRNGQPADIVFTSTDMEFGDAYETCYDDNLYGGVEGTRYYCYDESTQVYKEYVKFIVDGEEKWAFIDGVDLTEVDAVDVPSGVIPWIYSCDLRLSLIDTAANPDCIFTSSMYGIKSCLYTEGEDYDVDKNFDSEKCRLVYDEAAVARFATADYSVYEELQTAENQTEAYEAFFSKLVVEYKRNIEDDNEIFPVYNMGERLSEISREESESSFSGKTAVVVGTDGLHYISYYYDLSSEQGDAPFFDGNKYILLINKEPVVEPPVHTHTPGDWVTEKEATESEEGSRVQKCTECGEIINRESIPKLTPVHTHTPGDWVTEKEATGSEEGSLVQKCTGCGEILNRKSIPKFTVTLNVKSIPLQVKKSTTAVKATVMEGDAVASWKSSNTKVAAVSKSGKITGKKTGTAKITVTTKKGATASVKVTVQKGIVKAQKIAVDKKTLTLKVKKSYTLKTVLTPVTTTEKVTYTTSNKKAAVVSKKGKITAKKAGKATITVKCGKKKVAVKVTVKK